MGKIHVKSQWFFNQIFHRQVFTRFLKAFWLGSNMAKIIANVCMYSVLADFEPLQHRNHGKISYLIKKYIYYTR